MKKFKLIRACVNISAYFIALFIFSGIACGDEQDVPVEASELQTKVFNVRYADPDELSGVLNSLKSLQGKVVSHSDSGSIIVFDHPVVIDRMEDVINQLDVRKKQVLINVLITETTGEALRRAGITSAESIITPENYQRVKYFLENNENVSIRSEMSVRTLSGHPARLSVAQEEIYPGSVYRDEDYTYITPTRVREAGNFLECLPKVNNDGTISVNITPSMSEFTGNYTKHERKILTQVIINEGDTLVLGGLDQVTTGTRTNEVPFTGFSGAGAHERAVKTVMFLTVTID